MDQPLEIVGAVATGLAVVGCAYLLFAGLRMRAFARAPAPAPPQDAPSVTVLKPLHGAEPGLEAALTTILAQDYPGECQLLMGLQDRADPALAVAERLRAAHPERDIRIVVAPQTHGTNRKVSNLMNMVAEARHAVLVLSDSDIAVEPDYLSRVTGALAGAGVGVVTCPYYGLPRAGFWSRLAAMGVTYQFLPSVVVGLALGMAQPCMGSTVALRGEVLRRIGGFERFRDVLADDYAIGAAVRAAGLRSLVAPILVGHGCAEQSAAELMAHELRWARTVRNVDPAGFAGSGVTHAVPLALAGAVLSGGAPAAMAVLAAALCVRLWMLRQVETAAPPVIGAWWLFPARDLLSFAVFVACFFVRVVEWRGERFRVDAHGGLTGT